jgi:dienelactone hydrolase
MTRRKRSLGAVSALAVALTLAFAGTAGAAGYPACLTQDDHAHNAITHVHESRVQNVTIPDRTKPGHSFAGHLYVPRNRTRFPGKRPAVAVMHGINANPCSIRWIDRYLAGKGFVAIDVYRIATDADPATPKIDKPDMSQLPVAKKETALHRAALLSAVAYLRSPMNGHAKIIARGNISLVGHSLGATAVNLLQGQIKSLNPNANSARPGVRAAVALDGLKRFAIGDLGSAFNCQNPTVQVVPKVPALGFAKGESCDDFGANTPAATDPDQKLGGFRWWKGHKTPAMELVMAGFTHDTFTGAGTNNQLKLVAYYTLNWIKYFALGKHSAGQNLLTTHPAGRPLQDVLSPTFYSALYVPGLKVCHTPLPGCLP